MTTLADSDLYTVTAERGALRILRKADGKVATIKGNGLASQFRKHLASHDGQANRVTNVWLNDQPVVWQ